jgi:hypothetical protein
MTAEVSDKGFIGASILTDKKSRLPSTHEERETVSRSPPVPR